MGVGALLGLCFGFGVYLVIVAFGPVRARSYVLRMQAYLVPAAHRARPRFTDVIGASRLVRIEQRQARAGLPGNASAHVLELAVGSVSGLLVGSGLLALLTALRGMHQPAAVLPLLMLSMTFGYLVADRRLDTRAKWRRERAIAELPGIAEALAIAVSAGAALPHACALVAEQLDGTLAGELTKVVDDVRAGQPLDAALSGVSSRLPLPAVGRFVDAMRIALERGTPIVDVMHAQAADARNESRRALMEQAGRREVAMLIPVVFLVLPAVVVIALYPGFRELTTMV